MQHLSTSQVHASHRSVTLSSLALVVILVIGIAGLYLAYALAQNLTWQFDDYANLRTLAEASNPAGVINFVFGGASGPLGRPLSLATFLASYDDWPSNPWGMVQLTLVVHAMNGALIFLILRRVLVLSPFSKAVSVHSQWLALATAILWLWLPIHASSVLMPVQRMTHVSAFFSLLALYGFVVLRQLQGGKIPGFRGILLINLWLATTIFLSILGKENGATALTFSFLIEIFCFYPTWKCQKIGISNLFWRAWVFFAASAVTAALLVYVFSYWTVLGQVFELYRGYQWNEHIATQWVISLEYLRQIIIPRSALLGPFHDNHRLYGWTDAPPYVAIVVWGALLWYSAQVGRSQKYSIGIRGLGWVGFAAILWFFAGHQLESTFIPLELYFEHRNYLASLGFCLFFVLALNHFWTAAYRKVVPWTLALVYVAFIVTSLVQLTSLWGQPLLANDLWQKNNPQSTRAAQAVAQNLFDLGYQKAAFEFSDEFIREQRSLDMAILLMPERCQNQSEVEQTRSFKQIQDLVSKLQAPGGIPTGLAKFGEAVRNGKCSRPKENEYEALLREILERPQVNHSPKVRHHVYYELALMAKQRNDPNEYIDYLKKAFWDYPTISLAQLVSAMLFKEQRIEEAIAWIDEVVDNAPNAALHTAWRDTLQSMRGALTDIKHSLDGPSFPPDAQQLPSQ